MDERWRRLRCRHLLGGVVCGDPSPPVALPVSSLVMGGFCRWRGKAAGVGGWLEGGCRAHMMAAKIMLAARGHCMGVGLGCLQRTPAAGVAWQLPVRCGTASDGACSNNTVGRLGL
jgi:hypothetical protein